MKALRTKAGFMCDTDGVIYHGDALLSGRAVRTLRSVPR